MTLPAQSDVQRQAVIDQLFIAFEQADLRDAMRHAQTLTAEWPDCAFGWKALGVVLLERDEYDAALQPLERARALTPEDVEVLNSIGNVLVNRGDAGLAEQAYREAILLDPTFFDPYRNLARLLEQQHDWLSLDQLYGEIAQKWPSAIDVHSGYALALLQQRRWKEAKQVSALAIDLIKNNPEFPPDDLDVLRVYAHANERLGAVDDAKAAYVQLAKRPEEEVEATLGLARLAILDGEIALGFEYVSGAIEKGCLATRAKLILSEALINVGKGKAAIDVLYEMVQLDSTFADAWSLLGRAYLDVGDYGSSVRALQRSCEIKPEDAGSWNNLGAAYLRINDLLSAREAFEHAISLDQDNAMIHANLARVFAGLGLTEDAKKSIEISVQINPNDADSKLTQAKIFYQALNIKEAQEACNEALKLAPEFSEGLNFMAHMAHENGHNVLAINLIQRALKSKPNEAMSYWNLGNIYRAIGQFKLSVEYYIKGLQLQPDNANAMSNMLFSLNYVGEVSPQTALEHARRYGSLIESQATFQYERWRQSKLGQRLRVGFISGDLHSHPVGFLIEALLNGLDPERFELHAYSTVATEDSLTRRIKSRFARWQVIAGYSIERSANIVHEDGIHVLVDLAGHTANSGLPIFAYKPAPVQVAYLGYFATTGVAQIDYILGDRYVTPECDADHFSERIWQLPDSYWCYSPPGKDQSIAKLPMMNNGYITFGCFNNTSKINVRVLDLWARILKDLPRSRLILQARQLGDDHIRQVLIDEFVARGIDSKRIICRRWSNMNDYLNAYSEIDVSLDPFPFPGGATSMDSLWMGVPVISMRGDRLVGHNAETIAHNLGLASWLCSDADEYHALALSWAGRADELALLRSGLRERMRQSPLMDGPRFATHVGQAFEQMYREWQQGQDQRPHSAGDQPNDE